MNENKPDNPKAFPLENDYHVQEGMDLRDYFAAKAMQGAIVNWISSHEELVSYSYIVADEMLKQREI